MAVIYVHQYHSMIGELVTMTEVVGNMYGGPNRQLKTTHRTETHRTEARQREVVGLRVFWENVATVEQRDGMCRRFVGRLIGHQ